MSDQLTLTDRDGVRWIEMNRPETKNGLTPELNAEIIEALASVAGDSDLRTVVLTGAGGSFSSGLDLKDAASRVLVPDALGENLDKYFHGLIRAIRDTPVPTIAAVDGVAAGFGFDLALACDLRFVSARAWFAEIFVRRGLIPDGGGTFFLPRLIGLGRALHLMYTGDKVDAENAVEIGLANQRFPDDEFHDRVWQAATKLAKGPPIAYRLIKQAAYAGLDGTLEDALAREKAGQLQCLASSDFREGVAAFLQKRPPSFEGE